MATKLTLEEVKKIASLAKLELSEAELEDAGEKLARVLEHMNELSKLTEHASLSAAVIPKDAVAMREDAVTAFSDANLILQNAPALSENNLFELPTIRGEES